MPSQRDAGGAPPNKSRPNLLFLALILSGLISSCGGGGGETSGSSTQVATAGGSQSSPLTELAPEQTAIKRLNEERAKCGFGSLAPNDLLSKAALNHAEYNAWQAGALLNISLHIEVLGQPLFTGVTLFDRVAATGYPTAEVWENVNSLYWRGLTNSSRLESLNAYADDQMRGLMTMVYHLKGVMVNTNEIGMAVIERVYNNNLTRQLVVELGTQIGKPAPAQTDLMTYPCQGAVGAKSSFSPASETPNPRPGFTGQLGTPIYFRTPPGEKITFNTASVTALATGQRIGITTMTRDNDPARELGVEDGFILPDAPLTAGASYQVSANVTGGTKIYQKTFVFRPS